MGMCTQAKYFEDEIRLPDLKHNKAGLLCMASAGENLNTSQFYITMRGEDMEVGRGGFHWAMWVVDGQSCCIMTIVANLVAVWPQWSVRTHSSAFMLVGGWVVGHWVWHSLNGARHAFIRVYGIQHLDGKHTIFGEVAEDEEETLRKINELYCDTDGRPYR